MVIGIAFISFVTAGVTSALIQRAAKAENEAERDHREEIAARITDELAQLQQRLDAIDAKLPG